MTMMRMVVRHLGSVAVCLAGVICITERALYADASTEKRWLTEFPHRTPERIELREVYVTPAKDRALDRSVWPERNDRELGARLAEDGKSVSWPNLQFVTGKALLGPPPDGDFVPESVAGTAYKSPGYQTRK